MKRIVLFIVEGPNDKKALELALQRLLDKEAKAVMFETSSGDITSDFNSTDVMSELEKRCGNYGYEAEDIQEIVVLLDMDGAFVDNSAVIEDPTAVKARYEENQILHMDPKAIMQRNALKRERLRKLTELSTVPYKGKPVPFSVYFFSCNLDHVICNSANNTKTKKSVEAAAFRREYATDPAGFLRFFRKGEIAVGTSYPDSWLYIKQGLNSLRRGSNFHVYLQDL